MIRSVTALLLCGVMPAAGQTVLNPFRALVGTTAGTLAAGDDARIVGALQGANNLSDLISPSVARGNLGLGSIAQQSAGAVAITGGVLGGITLGNEGDATYNASGARIDNGTFSIWNQNQYGFQNTAIAASITTGPQDAVAQVIGGTPGLVAQPSGIALYQDRDQVALYVGTYNRAPYLPGVTAASFTATSVVLTSPVNVAALRVNMFIDTGDNPKFTGIITGWSADGLTINVSGWYQVGNVAAGQVPQNTSLIINPNTKIWAINANADVYSNGQAQKATGFELGINNRTGVDDTPNQLWGMDVVNLGTNLVGTGYFARGYMVNAFRAGNGLGSTGTNAGYLYDPGATGYGAALLSYAPAGCLFAAWNSVRGQTLCGDSATGSVDLGAVGVSGQVTSPALRFHTTGGLNSYDAQILPTGGISGTVGAAGLQFYSSSNLFQFGAAQSLTVSPDGAGAVSLATPAGQSLVLAAGTGGVIGTTAGLEIGAPQLEIGASQAAVGTAPYIDFHYGTGVAQDYNVRLTNDGDGQISFFNVGGRIAQLSATGLSVFDILPQSVKAASVVLAGPVSGSAAPSWRQLGVGDVAGAAPAASPIFSGVLNYQPNASQGLSFNVFGPNGIGVQATGVGQDLYLGASGVANIVAQSGLVVAPGQIEVGSTSSTGYVDFHFASEPSATDYQVRLTDDAAGQLSIYGPGSVLYGRFSSAGFTAPTINGDVTNALLVPTAHASTGLGAVVGRVLTSLFPGGVVNAADYGVVCDGHTDATATINAALAATSSAVGGVVVLPGGQCLVSGTININNNNVELRGQGMSVTYIISNAANFNVISLNGGFNQAVRDLSIFNYGFPSAAGAFYAIADGAQAGGSGGAVIENVGINGTESGIESRGGKTFHHHIDIENIKPVAGIGMLFDTTTSSEVHDIDQVFMQNPFPVTNAGVTTYSDMAACIKISGGFDYEMTHLQLQKCGVPLYVTGGGSIRSLGGYFDTSQFDAVRLDGSINPIVRVSLLGGWTSSAATGDGVRILGKVTELEVADVECYANGANCIDASAATNVDGLLIHGLKAAGNAGCAITVAAGLSGFTISNVVSAAQGEWGVNGCGITIPAGASNNYMIVGSRLQGSGSANLSDGGTGVNKLVGNNLVGP